MLGQVVVIEKCMLGGVVVIESRTNHGSGGQHCLARVHSDLEATCRNPTGPRPNARLAIMEVVGNTA